MSKPKQELLKTNDGSLTIYLPEWNESYHSKHGAIQEAYHVFIRNGLDFFSDKKEVSILEIGFGTGLNAFITLLESENRNQKIDYTAIEAFPVSEKFYNQLNYPEQLSVTDRQNDFLKLHLLEWENKHNISDSFSLQKKQLRFEEICFEDCFDLIYFDAFGYRVQPELWSLDIFRRTYRALKNKGILTTYACRSLITRNLKESGFEVKKVNGAIGKREMTLAFKNLHF